MIRQSGARLANLLPRSYIGFFDFFPGLKEIRFDMGNQFPIPNPIQNMAFLNDFPQKNMLNCFEQGMKAIYGKEICRLQKSQTEELERQIVQNYESKGYFRQIFQKYNITDILCDLPYNILGDNLETTLNADFGTEIHTYGVFRLNSLLFSFDLECWNKNTSLMGQYCRKSNQVYPKNFDDFLSLLELALKSTASRCIGAKCASAYERTLDFGDPKDAPEFYSLAKSVYNTPIRQVPIEKQIQYGNYLFHFILNLLRKSHIPIQIHTGTAIQPGSHPQNLEKTLAWYHDVDFNLLHFGYPWTDSVIDLIQQYNNCYSDFTWIPQLDAQKIQKLAFQLTEKNLWNKIMAFGGDCACIEGSVGALEILMHNLTIAFTKLHQQSTSPRLTIPELEEVIHSIFTQNPKKIFKIAEQSFK
jgi:hypothetical protein